MEPNNGMTLSFKTRMREAYVAILANLTVASADVKRAHWNVEGPTFIAIHELFDKQYEMLEDMKDETAERIRQLGFTVPDIEALLDDAQISIDSVTKSDERYLISHTVDNLEAIVRQIAAAMKAAADTKDIAADDFLPKMSHDLEKQAWFLRSHL